jgi:hypothetical protein
MSGARESDSVMSPKHKWESIERIFCFDFWSGRGKVVYILIDDYVFYQSISGEELKSQEIHFPPFPLLRIR